MFGSFAKRKVLYTDERSFERVCKMAHSYGMNVFQFLKYLINQYWEDNKPWV